MESQGREIRKVRGPSVCQRFQLGLMEWVLPAIKRPYRVEINIQGLRRNLERSRAWTNHGRQNCIMKTRE